MQEEVLLFKRMSEGQSSCVPSLAIGLTKILADTLEGAPQVLMRSTEKRCMIDDVGGGGDGTFTRTITTSILEVEGIQGRGMDTSTRVLVTQNRSRKAGRSITNYWR